MIFSALYITFRMVSLKAQGYKIKLVFCHFFGFLVLALIANIEISFLNIVLCQPITEIQFDY